MSDTQLLAHYLNPKAVCNCFETNCDGILYISLYCLIFPSCRLAAAFGISRQEQVTPFYSLHIFENSLVKRLHHQVVFGILLKQTCTEGLTMIWYLPVTRLLQVQRGSLPLELPRPQVILQRHILTLYFNTPEQISQTICRASE